MSVTRKIAAYTVKEANSDVRVGIKALFYWATHGRKDVEKCFENARKDIYVDLITDLSDTNLLILKAVTLIADKFAKKVFAAYNDVSRRNNVICIYADEQLLHKQVGAFQEYGSDKLITHFSLMEIAFKIVLSRLTLESTAIDGSVSEAK